MNEATCFKDKLMCNVVIVNSNQLISILQNNLNLTKNYSVQPHFNDCQDICKGSRFLAERSETSFR